MEERINIEGESPEAILSFAKERGIELTDDQLEKVTGGNWSGSGTIINFNCSNCTTPLLREEGEEYKTCTWCGHRNGPFH